MDYRVIINSTGRADVLASKTLPLLRASGLEPEVWVSSEQEQLQYAAVCMDVRIYVAPHDPTDKRLEVVGKEPVGLGKARNHVIRNSRPGERLVFIDDDLTGVSEAISPKEVRPLDDLDWLFRSMFRDTEAASATLWGLYPVANPYFMKPRVRYDLVYICGGLFGVIVTGKEHELVTLDDKEDFERSIRHYLADGHVVRNEHFCLGTTGYKGAGGMQLSRTPLRVRAAAEWLTVRYPNLCQLNTSKRSGWTEVRLRDKRPAWKREGLLESR
jgi:hypothetical protein